MTWHDMGRGVLALLADNLLIQHLPSLQQVDGISLAELVVTGSPAACCRTPSTLYVVMRHHLTAPLQRSTGGFQPPAQS
jgi:hypothetical protein